MAHNTMESLEGEQLRVEAIKSAGALRKFRDGACHELVMWYIHHLSESAREEVKERVVLPLLPAHQHDAPNSDDVTEAQVHERYSEQVSCAICHVAPTTLV